MRGCLWDAAILALMVLLVVAWVPVMMWMAWGRGW